MSQQAAHAHRVKIEPVDRRVTVRFGGRTVVDTTRAVTLREGGMPPVLYLPREDADMTLLERTARTSHCPFKGEASYYSVRGDEGQVAQNAVWTYEKPLPG